MTDRRPDPDELLARVKAAEARTRRGRLTIYFGADVVVGIVETHGRAETQSLVDELAHTNAPGSRHAKRWQDVDGLLTAGIDVHTTLNVPHIESLNDDVAKITGVVVKETVPDAVLALADEIELVDVSPELLIQRLREGKVYLPATAARALDQFCRKGNLLALRELATGFAVRSRKRWWRGTRGSKSR